MNTKPKIGHKFSRRKILPILGSTLLLPLLGFAKSETNQNVAEVENDEDYEIYCDHY